MRENHWKRVVCNYILIYTYRVNFKFQLIISFLKNMLSKQIVYFVCILFDINASVKSFFKFFYSKINFLIILWFLTILIIYIFTSKITTDVFVKILFNYLKLLKFAYYPYLHSITRLKVWKHANYFDNTLLLLLQR